MHLVADDVVKSLSFDEASVLIDRHELMEGSGVRDGGMHKVLLMVIVIVTSIVFILFPRYPYRLYVNLLKIVLSDGERKWCLHMTRVA